ncbi:hypothetical protein BU24DRAFT_425051 [Aaosphaeria arxii CBS 175.79]|uniref:Protein kinase domain-containing protein n=1 Tax=Aaosphaeria arxii CBS 175.79 TaxID=1450172 RepID=A0A6A5XM78_9PLEO|nr:uncharacterized protein BU24DRAFT_425051 [Aaosphaeria arxii CBS 175.79]KAF2014053.1 hypothetical protein BU24DRAFT_425051 [Aaosphaeria arxii CBS 175.79]
MADVGLGVVGLIGLFNTCLEGYKICLSIQDSDDDLKLLRARMYLEKERFANIGRTCGLLGDGTGDKGRTEALNEFLAKNKFRRKSIEDILVLIDNLLEKAEELNKKYEENEGLPEALQDNDMKEKLAGKFRGLKRSLRKGTWSIRDKAAYEQMLGHLVGFNTALERILPDPLQQFLATVLPATICASSNEDTLTQASQIPTSDAFLKSQIQWTSEVLGVVSIPRGTELDIASFTNSAPLGKDKSRLLATDANSQTIFIEWTPWERVSMRADKPTRASRISGLLRDEKCDELRLLPCAGYLEEHSDLSDKVRYGLAYRISTRHKKVKSLYDLLESFQTIRLPALEARFELARTLCRAVLLYHSSGWIHHDFRSHNIIFTEGKGEDGTGATSAEYQGVDIGRPFVVGFGHARDENDASLMFADEKAVSKTLKQQRRYWSPDYLASSAEKRTNRAFQQSHDIFSLGCVLLEIGVWRPLESYTWEKAYSNDHTTWYQRLTKEEGKLTAMCGSRYAAATMRCLNWKSANVEKDVRALAFEVLLKLEEITV